MIRPTFEQAVARIVHEDPRYRAEAYLFIRDALDYTVRVVEKVETDKPRHVTGRALLEGCRLLALREFGPLALRVLRYWGVARCEDFGEIVFNLVDRGIFGRRPEDGRADFADGYDFEAAFLAPFRPSSQRRAARGARRRASSL